MDPQGKKPFRRTWQGRADRAVRGVRERSARFGAASVALALGALGAGLLLSLTLVFPTAGDRPTGPAGRSSPLLADRPPRAESFDPSISVPLGPPGERVAPPTPSTDSGPETLVAAVDPPRGTTETGGPGPSGGEEPSRRNDDARPAGTPVEGTGGSDEDPRAEPPPRDDEKQKPGHHPGAGKPGKGPKDKPGHHPGAGKPGKGPKDKPGHHPGAGKPGKGPKDKPAKG